MEIKLTEMTNVELQALSDSINKIQIERMKILSEKMEKIFAELGANNAGRK